MVRRPHVREFRFDFVALLQRSTVAAASAAASAAAFAAALTLATLVWPSAASAQVPRTPSLVPVTSADDVELISCVTTTDLECSTDGCSLHTQQTYTFRNSDSLSIVPVTVGMLRQGTLLNDATQATLEPSAGITLDNASSNDQYLGLWDIRIAAGATSSVTVDFTRQTEGDHFVHWRWDASALSAWGTVDGMNVTFSLPVFVTEEALVSAEPGNYGFDGRILDWEYERPETMPRMDAIVLSPATWQRETALIASRSHYQLGQLYEEIQREASERGIPYDNLYERILAEYQIAATRAASSEEQNSAHLALARLYRSRANLEPGLALNYVILAAREIEQVLEARPDDKEIATMLSETYDLAARMAEAQGDSAGALSYVAKANTVPGAQIDHTTLEELWLSWAVEMAENGMVTQSLAEMRGVLPEELLDELLHYAPDVESVRTQIDLEPGARSAHYRLRLYPPRADANMERLESLVARLHDSLLCTATLATDEDDRYTLHLDVSVTFGRVEELSETSRSIADLVMGEEQDTLEALIAAPWQTDLAQYERHSNPWLDRYEYREAIDLSAPQTAWESEAQYANWRLIELRSSASGSTRQELVDSLALYALRDQVQTWNALPNSSYWVMCVVPDLSQANEDAPEIEPSSWLIAWGQSRTLDVVYPVYHRDAISRTMAATAVALLVLIAGSALIARARRMGR